MSKASYDRFFGPPPPEGCEDYALSSKETASEFGKINVRRGPRRTQVRLTFLMEPSGPEAERWHTGVALDGSASMRASYGHLFDGAIPEEARQEYLDKGWVKPDRQDGEPVTHFSSSGVQDAIARGYLRRRPNRVEPLARQFIAYLAEHLDAEGRTSVIYWAGASDDGVEEVGEVPFGQTAALVLDGPRGGFGDHTRLTPAVRFFADRAGEAPRSLFVFLTDGKIHDLDEVKEYSVRLAREIRDGQRQPLKCVLIGIGTGIDVRQLEELDDLDSGTDVDVWDHKLADEMRFVIEIFAEIVSAGRRAAPSGAVYDSRGECVWSSNDGVPARLLFELPADAEWFEVEVRGRRIRQPIGRPARPDEGRAHE